MNKQLRGVKNILDKGENKLKNQLGQFKGFKIERNMMVFLLFFALSTLFWFLKALSDEYETELNYPVKFTNVPEEVILENELPDKLKITVKDKGFALVRYKMSTSTFYFNGEINLKNVIKLKKNSKAQQRVVLKSSLLKERINRQLNVGTKLISVYPDTIPIVYSLDKEKKVPVLANIDIETRKQHMISGNIVLNPDSIIVYGPLSRLDTLKAVYTSYESYNKVSDTLLRNISLDKPGGVRLSKRRVVLTVPVEPFTEKKLLVPVVGLNFPDSLNLRPFPGEIEVAVFVGLSSYSATLSSDFLIGVDYHEVRNNSSGKAALKLERFPSFVRNPKLKMDSIEYLIEYKD